MNYRIARLDTLITADWNYKDNDDFLKERLKANLKKNGVVQNLVVREWGNQYEVVDGNHRLEALRELKVEEVMVCDMGEMSNEEAALLSISLNETKFQNDDRKLSDILKELDKIYPEGQLEELIPFALDELDYYLNFEDMDWDNQNQEHEDSIPEAKDTGFFSITVQVKQDVYETWDKWCKQVQEETDSTSKGYAFEYAITKALKK